MYLSELLRFYPCNMSESLLLYTGVGFGDHCAFIYTAEMAPPRYFKPASLSLQSDTIVPRTVAFSAFVCVLLNGGSLVGGEGA